MSKRVGLRRMQSLMGKSLPIIEFFFGGTALPSVAAAAACIGASQPPEQLNVELSGVVKLTHVPSVLTSETSPVKEASAPPGKVDEELEAA